MDELKTVIETLTDNNAILLLYLVGELPEADRLEVEKRIAADGNLAEQLAELRGIHQQISARFAALDMVDSNRLSPDNAIDNAVASVEGWHFGPRLVMPQLAPSKHRLWAWIAPASLAASILIAAMIWMERRPELSNPADAPIAMTQPTNPDVTTVGNDSDSNLALLQQSFSTGFEQTPRRAISDRPEVASRDDLSDYLLKTEVGQQ